MTIRPAGGAAPLLVTVALLTPLVGCSSSGHAAAPPPKCDTSYVYTNVKDGGTALEVVDAQMSQNQTGSTETWSVSTTREQTLSIQESESTTVKAHVAVAGTALVTGASAFVPAAEGQANAVFDYEHRTDSSVSRTSSKSTNTKVAIQVPPGTTAYALYGVVMKWTTGTVRTDACGGSTGGGETKTFILPEAYTWCSWFVGPDSFTDGNQSPCEVVPGQGPQSLN
ncbi:hypothetical protein ACFVSN_07555 [Kitasatospora sp. NPDC057904]|uniref:hypothetical protein n=1 Tax=Kitasatospora sp. NPDC057904 TaxID=3346275 RepID=UPI0036DE7D10